MAPSAALIGVGALGQALLQRLIAAGVATTTYDVSPLARAAAQAFPARSVESPSLAVAEADYVHLCVRTDEEVELATLGPDGIIAAMKPGATLIVHSTVMPATTRRMEDAVVPRGLQIVDASVVGMPAQVLAGDASFLVGGEPEIVAVVRPYLLALGRAVYDCGPLGAGNVAKIAKNLATAADRVVLVEVLALAEAGGLDPQSFLEMISVEHRSCVTDWGRVFDVGNGHARPLPATNLLNKDIGHAADFAAASGLDLPVTRAIAASAAAWVRTWNEKRDVVLAPVRTE
jgi:3-hydroxyisobutyrate dehydrogenase-like beta-hydroxyacid dehydrogenase